MNRNTIEHGAAGMLATLRKLRDQWLLIAALVSALFWVRDLVETHRRLPEQVAGHAATLATLDRRLGAVEAVHATCGRGADSRTPLLALSVRLDRACQSERSR
jgi:hypothetical protein